MNKNKIELIMKWAGNNKIDTDKTKSANQLKSIVILLVGLVLTLIATIYLNKDVEEQSNKEFALVCNEIYSKIETRLETYAQVLRNGTSFFASSDSVTRAEWKSYIMGSMIERNLPGIQGVGFSLIIPKNKLQQHIEDVRKEGFHDYNVVPSGEREIYTSIIYLEPFTGRNLRAFGYDMFSEPVRRKAMEQACDNNVVTLSGKVILRQETDRNIQFGTLMYVPVYRNGKPINTIGERRAAIIGWVYSPYRMNDLMKGILGRWDSANDNRMRLQIFDNNSTLPDSLMYDSQNNERQEKRNSEDYTLKLSINFNGKEWTLLFSQSIVYPYFLDTKVLLVLISGFIISLLLYALVLALLNTRSKEIEIQQKNIVLAETIASKDKFFAIIAHDLRSPFTGLLGLSELMVKESKDYTKEELLDLSEGIYKSANSLFKLVNDLLQWARTQSNSIPFHPEELDLSEICINTIFSLKNMANNKNIEIIQTIQQTTNLTGDRNMLSVIFRNLLSNAIKFTNIGGRIEIGIMELDGNDPENTCIYVRDNGTGISKDKINNLFRIDACISTKGTCNEKGTGLGLIMCKEFVEKHGGKIWVVSKEGKGSTFYFTIPQ